MSATDVQTTPDSRQWFVRMVAGGAVFGPIRTNGLVLWAAEGRVMPDDEISEDKVHWIPAQELPELCMDTLIAHPNGSFIGPFHRDALQALIREGKIPPDAQPFPKSELSQRLAARQMSLFGDDPESAVADSAKPHRKKSTPANDGDSTVVAQLRKELDETKEQCSAAESDAATAREAAAKAAAERDAAIAERDALQANLAAAESDAATAREAAAKAAAERDAAIAERDTLQANLAAAESDAATAREAAAKAAAERDAAIAERDALQANLAAAESDAATAREAAAKAAAEREAFQAKLDAASAELASVLAARDAAESDAASAHEAAAKAAEERDAAVAAMNAAKAERDAATSEANDAHEAAEKAAEERDVLQAKLEETKREHSELLEFSNARDADYQKTIGDLENTVSELRSRFAENDNSAQGESVLRSRLHEREMDILCLARQLATASESAREREAALLKRIEDLEGGYGSLSL